MLMRTALSILLMLSVLAGCVMASEWPARSDMPPTRTYGPDRNGIVCYEAVRSGRLHMSCVTVETDNRRNKASGSTKAEPST